MVDVTDLSRRDILMNRNPQNVFSQEARRRIGLDIGGSVIPEFEGSDSMFSELQCGSTFVLNRKWKKQRTDVRSQADGQKRPVAFDELQQMSVISLASRFDSLIVKAIQEFVRQFRY